jgi:hypothetical protein
VSCPHPYGHLEELARLRDLMSGWVALARKIVEDE